jgi:hypothetical protein
VQVLPALALDGSRSGSTPWWSTGKTGDNPSRANLVRAVLVGIVTVTAARNLPGVLEITVLQRLSINAGSRYTITEVSRYVIVAVGTSGAFNPIGPVGRRSNTSCIVLRSASLQAPI